MLLIIYAAEMVNKIRSVIDRNNIGLLEIRIQYFIHKAEEQIFNIQKVKEYILVDFLEYKRYMKINRAHSDIAVAE